MNVKKTQLDAETTQYVLIIMEVIIAHVNLITKLMLLERVA